jgi:hypothetical protein
MKSPYGYKCMVMPLITSLPSNLIIAKIYIFKWFMNQFFFCGLTKFKKKTPFIINYAFWVSQKFANL